MSILITSPTQGSLKVVNTNPAASVCPDTFYTNLSTVTVRADPNYQANSPTLGAVLLDSVPGNVATFPLWQISQIAASTQSFGLQWAVDSIAALVMH